MFVKFLQHLVKSDLRFAPSSQLLFFSFLVEVAVKLSVRNDPWISFEEVRTVVLGKSGFDSFTDVIDAIAAAHDVLKLESCQRFQMLFIVRWEKINKLLAHLYVLDVLCKNA